MIKREKILKKFESFKSDIREIEGHKVVFSTDSNGIVWHEYANAVEEEEHYIMVTDGYITSKTDRPDTLSPIDGCDIYVIENNVFEPLDKIVINGEFVEELVYTDDEIEEIEFKKSVRFYNEELEFATKAVAELKCEIISPEDFEDVKVYMQSIDPYAQNYKRAVKNKRPSIFDRYN